ncbi:MAG: ACP S-malonyltransferase [Bacteroidetes bacterium]|nr:ACP S-malonyltransferase [Bacteroidota bacterium]
MKMALLFPGQASQYVGMGKDLFANVARARELFDIANDIMATDLTRICFEGPADELKQTRYTQPAIFVHSVIVAELLDFETVAAAGHSLGEYSALVIAGALTFEDGMRLVKKRGELMQEAGTRSPGTMAAVIGADAALVEEACAEASSAGIVQPANFNSPGQIVISGSLDGIDRAMEVLKEKGVRIVKKLPVSGAFHSPLMQYAQDELGAVLDGTPIRDARFPVYTNVTATPVTSADDIRSNLLLQVTSPVLWERSMENMIADGVERFVEAGPGNVLQGLLKRINADLPCVAVGSLEELRNIE